MKAYIIVYVEILNEQEYSVYKTLTPASLQLYGGKFIVRGGHSELLEGRQHPQRIVVLEFRDKKSAKDWWASNEYAEAKQIRQRSANTNMILVEGFNPLG